MGEWWVYNISDVDLLKEDRSSGPLGALGLPNVITYRLPHDIMKNENNFCVWFRILYNVQYNK